MFGVSTPQAVSELPEGLVRPPSVFFCLLLTIVAVFSSEEVEKCVTDCCQAQTLLQGKDDFQEHKKNWRTKQIFPVCRYHIQVASNHENQLSWISACFHLPTSQSLFWNKHKMSTIFWNRKQVQCLPWLPSCWLSVLCWKETQTWIPCEFATNMIHFIPHPSIVLPPACCRMWTWMNLICRKDLIQVACPEQNSWDTQQ